MIQKNADGLYDLVCDNCEDTQAEIDGDASFDEFDEAVEYKKEHKDRWKTVKDKNKPGPKEGWADLCYVCFADQEVVNKFKGYR